MPKAAAGARRRQGSRCSVATPRGCSACAERRGDRRSRRRGCGSPARQSLGRRESGDPGRRGAGGRRAAPATDPTPPGWRSGRRRRPSTRLRGVAPGRADGAVAAVADEVEDLVHELVRRELLGDVLDPLLEGTFVREEQPVGAADIVDLVAGEAAPPHADDVEAGEVRAVADRHPVGNDVLGSRRHAGRESMRADAHELMHADAAAEDGVVADLAMTAEHDVVRHDDVIADDAVVGDMRVGEEEAVIADARPRRALRRAWIEGHAFPDGAVRSDEEHRRLAGIFQVLRLVPDRGEGEDLGARPDRGVTGQHDVAHELRAGPELDICADDAERPDPHALAELCARLDDGGRVDERLLEAAGLVHSVTSMAPTSASATITPATFASPLNHHMLRRLLIFLMWYSMTSPGTTGLRNFALSIVMKNTCVGRLSWLSFVNTQTAPAVCAMPSTMSTPGNSGRVGKCPMNWGSFMVTFLMPMQDVSPSISMILSTRRNG